MPGKTKLTHQQIDRVLELRRKGTKRNAIVIRSGLSTATVKRILSGYRPPSTRHEMTF